MDTESEKFKSTCSIRVIFILFGVASLLGWNALLTELEFFNFFVEKMKPFVSFSFLNYGLNILFQFLLVWKKDFIPLKTQLIAGIIGSIAFLILLPLFTIILERNSTINVIVTGGLVFLMGFINAICSAGFFNLVSHFPLELIVALSAGQGFSGVSMNVIQYIVLLAVKVDENDPGTAYIIRGWIFFISSSLILVVCLILLLINYNTEFFQHFLNKSENEIIEKTNLLELESIQNEEEFHSNENSISEEKKSSSFQEFKYLFSKIWDLDILMAYAYIVTFALFPNASIRQNLFGLDNDYSSNTVIITYNLFDTIGRYLVEKIRPNKKLNMIIVLGRSILLFTLIFNHFCTMSLVWNGTLTSILLILNVGLLAATNGMATTIGFGLGPNEVEGQYKGQVGTSLSFFIIVGIFLGACVGFGTDAIMDLAPNNLNNNNITNNTNNTSLNETFSFYDF